MYAVKIWFVFRKMQFKHVNADSEMMSIRNKFMRARKI